jgi:hypothetical protein
MADNITLNTGSGGASLASDDIGGVQHQRVKIQYGTDGSATDVSDTNPLPIDDAGGSLTVDATNLDIRALTNTDVVTVEQATHDSLNLNANLQIANTDVAATNPVPVAPDNLISSNNSTTSLLGISANFTGTGDDVSGFTSVTITVYADQASAADGMKFQFSTDNSNWDDSYDFTLENAGDTRRFQFPVTARYFRLNYTNGGTGQGAFRVQTIYHANNVQTSVHVIGDNTSPDRSATLTKSAIVAQAAGSGNFVPVQATAGGNFKVSVEEFAESLPAGTNAIGKLSANDGVDIGDVTINNASIAVTSASALDVSAATVAISNADLTTIAGAVSGTEMQVDIVSSSTLTVDLGANNDAP